MTATKRIQGRWQLPRAGEVVGGKYRIESTLGRGGLAVVFSAFHLQLRERVALKVLLPEWAEDADTVARFFREGQAAIKVRGEHVARVLDVEMKKKSGAPYIVMEHLEGSDLEDLLDVTGPLSVETAVDYILQTAEAVAEAHAVGIVHRDLKPANLFLTKRSDGSSCIKLLDFGISKVIEPSDLDGRPTLPELIMGSPHYMSPEQLTDAREADERSDIWALGAILYELLAGRPPFQGNTAPELCVNVMRDPPTPLSETGVTVPEAVEATILLCLEKDPEKRFSNVAELALALAPFGPPSAHATADRILRILQTAGRVSVSPESKLAESGTRMGGFTVSPQSLQPSVDSEPPAPSRRPAGSRFAVVAAASLLLMAGGGVAWMRYGSPSWPSTLHLGGRPPAADLHAPPTPPPAPTGTPAPASALPPIPSALVPLPNPATKVAPSEPRVRASNLPQARNWEHPKPPEPPPARRPAAPPVTAPPRAPTKAASPTGEAIPSFPVPRDKGTTPSSNSEDPSQLFEDRK